MRPPPRAIGDDDDDDRAIVVVVFCVMITGAVSPEEGVSWFLCVLRGGGRGMMGRA
jgi:hypothetical protein